MKALIVIPARGGSKGLPGKNIKNLRGKPLINYTVDAARAVFDDAIICVSTDDLGIKKEVERTGLKVPFLRPAELAQDTSGTQDVLIHAMDWYQQNGYKPDVIILLQPTSPFRRPEHIKEALGLFDSNCEMVVSVKETKANPYYLLKEENDEGWLQNSKRGNFKRRQDCPKVYELNGAVYIIDAESLRQKEISGFSKVKKYLMEDIHSIDVDTELDWMIAEFFYEKQLNER